MSRKSDPFTLDLLSWTPPKVTAGYEERVAGRGALDNRIARLIGRALKDAKDTGKKRTDIADAISAYLGRSISPTMLDKWASESSTDHRIPLDAFIALIDATGAEDLLGFVSELFGYVAVPEKYSSIIELHLLEDHERAIAARKSALEAKWGARR